ncbi:MAG: hypothetical protein IJD10_07635 [Clostridia bacterium]|nr:hypothetical protein [Clostridia bacterium]
MKRLLLPLFLLLLLALPCHAAPPEEAVKDLYDSLPPDVADALPEGLEEQWKEDAPTAAASLDIAFLFNAVGGFFTKAVKDSVGPLIALAGTLLLSAFLHTFSNTTGEIAGRTTAFASQIAVLLAVFQTVKPLWDQTANTVKSIGLLTKTTVPAMTALCVASGSLSSSAVQATWLSALLALTEQLTETVLMPLFGIAFGFLVVSLFTRHTEGGDLTGVVSGIKGAYTLLLTVFGTVLTVIMTYQSVLAQSADTVLLRSLKFASGIAIPVVGGALSETAGSYLASLSLLRSSTGILSAVAVLLCVFPPILSLLIYRFAFSVLASFAGILGCHAEGEAVREAAGLFDLALATVAIVGAVFLILAGVFASTAVSV